MVYKRRKRVRRTRRKRSMRVPRNRIRYVGQIYKFKRTTQVNNLVSTMDDALSTVAPTSAGYFFQLNDVPNVAEFTSLFDRYKFVGVKVKMYTSANNVQPSGVNPFIPVIYYSVIDWNSSGALATAADANEFQTCRQLSLNAPRGAFKRYIKSPRYIGVAEDAASSVIASTSAVGWINTSVPNIRHFGYRWLVSRVATGYTMSISHQFTYYLKFRGVK